MIGLFRSLWRNSRRSTNPKSTRRRAKSSALLVERLEDRLVPSTITWSNSSGGSWTTASNWDLGRIPGAGDQVVIPQTGITVSYNSSETTTVSGLSSNADLAISAGSVTVTSGATIGTTSQSADLTVSGGTLELDAASTVYGTMEESAGSLTGAGALTVTGQTTWTGGTMSGSGSTTAQGGLLLGLAGDTSDNETLDARTLVNTASAVWAGGGSFTQADASTMTNASGATFEIQNDDTWYADSASSFANAGTLTKSAGSNTTFDAALDNSGTIDVLSGTVNLAGGGDAAGTVFLAGGSALEYGSNFTATAPPQVESDGEGNLLVAQFTGPGAVASYSASIDWGDGTGTTEGTIVQNGDGSFSIYGTHDYTGGGTYDVTTTVSGLADAVVLFDPVTHTTTTALTSSANPSVYNQNVTFTATVSHSSGSDPVTGTVTFYDGSTTLGTATLNSSAVATFSISTLAVGNHTIKAAYGGDTNYLSSNSSTLTQTVDKDNTTTSVSSSVNPSTYSNSVTFTASVSSNSPGSGTPTGTVTFKDGTTTLGTATLSSGSATYTTSSMAVGSHSITVSYGGDGNDNTSTSSTLTQTVENATTTAVSSSLNASTYGQSVTFTATATVNSPGTGTPTGTVTFLDGTTTLGTATLTSGSATYTTSSLTAASHSITVSYAGDSTDFASTSSALTQTVNQRALTVTAATNTKTYDSTTSAAATPSITSGALQGSDTANFIEAYASATAGTGLTLTPSGTVNDGNGGNNYSYTFVGASTGVINMENSSTGLSSNHNPATAGQSITYTVSVSAVTSGTGTPTGTVSFYVDSALLGTASLSSGSATYSTSSLYVGSHTVTASYSGDSDFNSSSTSSALTQTVNPPLSFGNPGTQNGTEGVAISTLNLSSDASDSVSGATLTYMATGLPPGLYLNPTTGHITGTPALGSTAAGPYTVNASVTDGTYTDSLNFTWNVACPITFGTIANQSTTEGTTISTLSTAATDSISGSTLAYGAIGLPGGLAINTSNGNITGTVAAGAAVDSPYTITVIAGDDTYSATTTFTWTVTAPVSISAISDQTNYEGATPSLSVSATDSVSSSTLVYGAVGLPEGLSIGKSTGGISGTVAAGAAQQGPYYVTVSAGDGTYSASQSFTWNVTDAVAINVPADQTNNEGDSVSLSTGASDYYSGTLTYGATGLPAGLSINASTGAISGTVSTGDSADSPYSVTLFAGDGTYSDVESFNWTVNSPIAITDQGDQTNNVGHSPSVTIAASDTHSGTLSYSASGLPSGLSINSSTGVISGTLTAGGSFEPVITVSDGTYSATDTFNWQVNSTITITDSGDQTFNSGDSVSVPISATDTASGSLSYSATGLPSGLSINSSTGLISGTLSASAGNYTSTVSVTDGTDTELDSFAWTICPASDLVITNPGTQTSTDGTAISTLSIGDSYSGSGTVVWSAVGLPAGLAINPTNGHISGTPTAGDAAFSPYSVTVTATDGTNSDSQSCTGNADSPITLTNPGTQTTTEGSSGALNLSASYSGGSLTYSAVGLPAGLALDAATGAITGDVAVGAAQEGPYYVAVQASYGAYTATQDFTWNVNSPISFSSIADQTTLEGATISTLSVSATDSISGSTLVYSATGLPAGLQIDPSNGNITGTVAVGAAANGPCSVTITAEDGTNVGTTSFNWNVNSPVTFTQLADQTNDEGDTVSLSISASDSVSGSTLKYGASDLPAGLAINTSTGAITGALAADDSDNGPYSVTVIAGDGTYSSQMSFTWNVNSPLVIAVPNDQTNNAGDSVSLTLTAIDAISGATISWSASGLPTGLSINSSTGAITGTASQGGYWAPTITASDGTYSDVESFNWAVNSPIGITDQGDQANAIGDSVSVPITATDTASGTLSFSASGLPAGLSINSSTGVISGTVGTTASTTTPYEPVVTVTDGTNTAVDTFEWDINPSGAIVIAYPGTQTNTQGDEVALQVNATDSAGGTLAYSATGLPTGLSINPYTGYIFGTISSSAASSNSVAVTALDTATSATGSVGFDWTVNAGGAVTMANPGDQTNNDGDSVSLAISATDTTSGATLTYAAFGLQPGLKINPSTGAITGAVAVGADGSGPYTVTVVAGDGTNSASQTFTWNIFSPITVTQPADQTNNQNDSVSLSINASDSISGSTLQYAALGLPAGLSINPSTGEITGTVSKGAAADGPYSVTVLAQDGTYSSDVTFNWTVNSPVSITSPYTQTNNDGDSVTLDTAAIDSVSGSTVTYSAQGLPAGLSINASTGVVSGTIAVGDSSIGTFEPTIIANDGTYYSTASFEWNVNGAISVNDPGYQSNTVGDTVDLLVSATDTSGTPVYTATGLPAGLSINTSTGAITGAVATGAATIGSYTTTVSASDGTTVASGMFTWTITAAGTVTMSTPNNQTGTEGTAISTVSTSATDFTSGATLHYFAGGLPAGLKINPSTGAIIGTPAAGDAANGPYSVTVIAADGTESAQESFTWIIADPVTISTISDQATTEGDTVSLSVSANDSSSGTLTFAAVGLPMGLSINTADGGITGTVAPGAAANGPYSVMVTAGDGTYSTSQTFTWTVNSPISLNSLADQSALEGDSVALSTGAADSSGGTLRYSAIGLPAGLSVNSTTGAISGTVAVGAATSANPDFTLIASDGTYQQSRLVAWTVTNPITLNSPMELADASGSISLPIYASYSGLNSLSYQAFGLPRGLSINSSTGVISGTMTPALDGTYVATVTATNGVFQGATTLQLTVCGDPEVQVLNVNAVAFSNGARMLAAGTNLQSPNGGGGKVTFFEGGGNWPRLSSFKTDVSLILGVAFAPTPKVSLVAVGGVSGLTVWDLPNDSEVWTDPNGNGAPAFSNDSVAVTTKKGIDVLNAANGKLRFQIPNDPTPFVQVIYASNGNLIAIDKQDKITIWSGQKLIGESDKVGGVRPKLALYGNNLAVATSGDDDVTVYLFNVSDQKKPSLVTQMGYNSNRGVSGLAYTPNGANIMLLSYFMLTSWNSAGTEWNGQMQIPGSPESFVTGQPDHSYAAIGTSTNEVLIYNIDQVKFPLKLSKTLTVS